MPLITLVSCDGKSFQVETAVVKQSKVLNGLIEDLNLDITPDASAFPIPIRDVTGNVLEKVIEWCTHHKDDPVWVEERIEQRALQEWDQAFFEAIYGHQMFTVFNIIAAARNLDIKCLHEQSLRFVANSIMKRPSPVPFKAAVVFPANDDADDEVAEDPTVLRKCIDW